MRFYDENGDRKDVKEGDRAYALHNVLPSSSFLHNEFHLLSPISHLIVPTPICEEFSGDAPEISFVFIVPRRWPGCQERVVWSPTDGLCRSIVGPILPHVVR